MVICEVQKGDKILKLIVSANKQSSSLYYITEVDQEKLFTR